MGKKKKSLSCDTLDALRGHSDAYPDEKRSEEDILTRDVLRAFANLNKAMHKALDYGLVVRSEIREVETVNGPYPVFRADVLRKLDGML